MENIIEKRKSHSLTVENRSKAIMSGIIKVISSNQTEIWLETADGNLVINGNDMKINKFDVVSGELNLVGKINKFAYQNAKLPFLKRIFK